MCRNAPPVPGQPVQLQALPPDIYPHPIHWKGRQHCFSSQLSAQGTYLLSWLVFVVQLAYGLSTGSQEVISVGGGQGAPLLSICCLQFENFA